MFITLRALADNRSIRINVDTIAMFMAPDNGVDGTVLVLASGLTVSVAETPTQLLVALREAGVTLH